MSVCLMQTHDKPVGVIVRWNALWASTEQRQACAEDGTGVCFSLVCPTLASAALTHVLTLTHILQHTQLDYDSPPLTHLLSHRVLRKGALQEHYNVIGSPFLPFLLLSPGVSLFLPSLSPCPVYSSFLWVFVQPVPLPVPLFFWLPVLRGFPFPLKKMSPFIVHYVQCALKQ